MKQQPLPGMAEQIVARLEAEQIAMKEQIEDVFRTPLGNLSRKAGNAERDSPLFFGTGSNPSLF